MKKTKENKAITLVALVVTIIILLVLAGITIATLGGENGLFARVKLGKERYAISEAKEKLELEITNLQIEQQGKGEELKKEDLPKMNNDEIDVRDTTNFPVEVIYKNYKFEVDSNFHVTYVGEANETIITYTTEPDGYTNQNKVKVLVKISNPKGIKSILKPGETDKILPQDRTTAGIEFTVTKNGHYILKVEDIDGNEVSKDIYIELIDTLAPDEFTPEIQKADSSITVIENGKDAEATEESCKSGIDHYEYYLINSSNKETKYDTNKIENLELGTYKLYLIVFDRAGNSTKSNEVEFQVTVEFAKIAVGDEHNLAIDKEGNLFSWGGGNAEIEDGETSFATAGPAKMKLDIKVKEMSVGSFSHSLVIDDNGNLWSRAMSNSCGQLGNGTTEISKKLIKIKDNVKFEKVIAGEESDFAIDSEGNLWSWGNNNYGQIGNGGDRYTYVCTPIQIMIGTKFTQISACYTYSLAIDSEGNLWSWGENSYGQLGRGGTTTIPAIVKEGTKFAQISAGNGHSLAIDSEGNLWSWGCNYSGQLGDGTTTNKSRPVLVKTDKKFIQISAGHGHSLALDSNGNIWGWGSNGYWQLGISDRNNPKTVPVEIVPAYK